MAAPTKTHLNIFFIRNVRVQKADIAGEKNEGDLMRIVRKGETLNVKTVPATDMIIAGSAIEVKQTEKEKIEDFRRQFEEEREREKNAAESAGKKQKAVA